MRRELEQTQDRIGHLQQSEQLLDVYKKKLDGLSTLRSSLSDMKEHNHKLYGEIELL